MQIPRPREQDGISRIAVKGKETGPPLANEGGVKGSRQRYGMLLLALSFTFFFEGVAEPGDLQRAVGPP